MTKTPKQVTIKVSKQAGALIQSADNAVVAAQQQLDLAQQRFQLIATAVLAGVGISKTAKLVRFTDSKSPELVIELEK